MSDTTATAPVVDFAAIKAGLGEDYDNPVQVLHENHQVVNHEVFAAVTAAGQQFGHLLTDRSLNEAEQAVLERVSLHVALWMMLTRAREAGELRDGTEAVSALIDGTLDAAGARSVLE